MAVKTVKSPKPAPALPPICVVYGAEAFLKRQAIADIVDRVLGNADRSLALSEYDGGAAIALAGVLDDLRTLPFLSDRRLVLVRDADKFITDNRAALEDYADQPSPTGVLLMECRSFPGSTKLAKRVQAIGEAIECKPVAARAVPGWLVNRCKDSYNKRLDAQAAALLQAFIGDDLGLLDSELLKLSLYVGDRPAIAADDVQALVVQTREEQVWGILSAIATGDEAKALTIWEQVWETDRAAQGRSIAGIAYKVRQLLSARHAQQAGAPMNELAKLLMIWGDFDRVRAELAAFSTVQVERMLCRLLEADVAVKSGLATVQSAIEAFIIDACRARSARARRATG